MYYMQRNLVVVDNRVNLSLKKSNFTTHLKLAFTGKDADPLVVIVSNDDVTVGVDGHTRRPLQLTWSPAPHTEAAFELAIIGENLCATKYEAKFSSVRISCSYSVIIHPCLLFL